MLPRRAFRLAVVVLAAGALPVLAGRNADEDYLQQARRALIRNEAEVALRLAGKAIAANPKDARAYLVRGAAHEALRKHAEAVADFDKCLERDPRCAEAYDHRGSEQFKRGLVKESLADFDQFLKLEPKAAPGHWKRGISLYYVGRYDDGRKQFKDGEKVFADDVENAVWHFLCNARLVGVEKARSETLKIGRDIRVPMMEVYDLYLGKSKPAAVLTAAEKSKVLAEERKQQLFYAHLYLGLYYDVTGDKPKALEHMALAEGKFRIAHYMGDVAHVHADLLRKEVKK
jgi:lipoprotein NlpI